MSGNQSVADILPYMFHGGKIALLGIMPGSANRRTILQPAHH
jgi:hypothetical protein